MVDFSSDRERRLWLWTLAVVVAIYSTLGLAGTLAEELEERDLLGAAFGLGFLLVLVTIATQGFGARPRGVEIGIAFGVTAAVLMVFVRMGVPLAERTHLVEYGVVGAFMYAALTERAANGRRVPSAAAIAIGGTVAIGLVDELIQGALPNRVFDWRDVLFNTLAGTTAVLAGVAMTRVRGLGGRFRR